VDTLEYTVIPRAFFTPHEGWWRQQIASLSPMVQRNSYSKWVTKAAVLSKVIVALWSSSLLWSNKELAFCCCNSEPGFIAGYLLPVKTLQRQTDRHVHNVFFAHAWGWKEPFTGSVSWWRFFSLLLPHLRTSDKNSYCCLLRWWSVSWSTIPRLLWNPRSQGPATGLYPEPDESVAQSISLILIFIHAGSPSGLFFPSGLTAICVVKSIHF
jgi:hypothetical protein